MFTLGIVEFWVALELFSADAAQLPRLQAKHYIYPGHVLTDLHSCYLVCMFAVFLGLLRLSWVAGSGGFAPWVCIVLTHFMETVYLWGLALTSQHFNPKGYNVSTMVEKVLTLHVGTAESCVVLMVVPALVLLLLLHGPQRFEHKRRVP